MIDIESIVKRGAKDIAKAYRTGGLDAAIPAYTGYEGGPPTHYGLVTGGTGYPAFWEAFREELIALKLPLHAVWRIVPAPRRTTRRMTTLGVALGLYGGEEARELGGDSEPLSPTLESSDAIPTRS